MKSIRRRFKVVNVMMVFLLIIMSVPSKSVFAALISTEDVVHSERAAEARKTILDVLAREEIRTALIKQGIDPIDVQARVDSLTDLEAVELANKIEKAPAGGVVGVLIGVALVVFIVLVITDALGYTDIFPFIKSKEKSE